MTNLKSYSIIISSLIAILAINCNIADSDAKKPPQQKINDERIHYFKDKRVLLCFGYIITSSSYYKGGSITNVPCASVEKILTEAPDFD